ncbi:Metridin ShK toxin and Domain of unknown function DUF1794 domain containing protein [Aphelenchoides bicaudatus]|nr:Metridin ShK toxin and Domain of unknown function DUF1794 domain containing protein [Aphelenchoides bicaudatus]
MRRSHNPIYVVCLLLSVLLTVEAARGSEDCKDNDFNCQDWVARCSRAGYIRDSCPRSCGFCRFLPKSEFWLFKLTNLKSFLEFDLEFGDLNMAAKAMFPTIPKFTYGEQLEFSLSDSHMTSIPALNYTAFAWTVNQMNEELHSENGFIAVRPGSVEASMNTVMSNGFVTIEEGQSTSVESAFSRDLPVHDLIREWTLIDAKTLESRLDMSTLTHGMREHTIITYTKIFP